MYIVGISGSLRAESNNTKLIQLASRCCPCGVEFRIADQLGELPHFNPDLDALHTEVLAQWVEMIRTSDGLVISSPEYARGYPGTLKNALDWLVQTDAHIDKPFMLLNASDRSIVGRESLIVVLNTMSGIYCERASCTVPLLGRNLTLDQLLAMDEVVEKITAAMQTFVDEISSRQRTS